MSDRTREANRLQDLATHKAIQMINHPNRSKKAARLSLGAHIQTQRARDMGDDLFLALKRLIETSGHMSPFGNDPGVKAVREAAAYMSALDHANSLIAKVEGS